MNVTRVLAGLNVAVWLLGVGIESLAGVDWVQDVGARYTMAVWEGEVWRLLTAVFLHAGLLHLVLNTWALLAVGPAVEAIFGPARMLAIYLTSGVVGNAASTLWGGEASVGASGAIFGLFGALVFFGLRHRERLSRRYWGALLPTVVGNLVYGFTQPRIDNWAHLGGLAGGFLGSIAVGLPPLGAAVDHAAVEAEAVPIDAEGAAVEGGDAPADGAAARAGRMWRSLARAAAALALVAVVAWSLVPPAWLAMQERGRRLARAERWAEAEAALATAVQMNPRSADAHYLLAIVYLNTRRRAEAIRELERVLELYPGHPEVTRVLEQVRRMR